MRDELSDGDEREVVFHRELLELRTPRRSPVLVEDLTYDTGRVQSCESRQVNGRFRVSDPLKHATVARTKLWNVSRPSQIGRDCSRINRNLNRTRTILCTDSRRHTEPGGSIDAHRERSPMLLSIVLALLRKLKLVGTLARQRE